MSTCAAATVRTAPRGRLGARQATRRTPNHRASPQAASPQQAAPPRLSMRGRALSSTEDQFGERTSDEADECGGGAEIVVRGARADPGAAGRLREALDVLAGGELPECPVCKPLRATARN
eukprot:scaffold74008_cov72-Phaeocystis_antarctica.AAC.3